MFGSRVLRVQGSGFEDARLRPIRLWTTLRPAGRSRNWPKLTPLQVQGSGFVGVCRVCRVCRGVSGCVGVCRGVSGCVGVCRGVSGCVGVCRGVSGCVETDFGQTDFGHRYPTDFGQTDFGRNRHWPKTDFGQNRLWPNRLWPKLRF